MTWHDTDRASHGRIVQYAWHVQTCKEEKRMPISRQSTTTAAALQGEGVGRKRKIKELYERENETGGKREGERERERWIGSEALNGVRGGSDVCEKKESLLTTKRL
jgi:hypothetical protein